MTHRQKSELADLVADHIAAHCSANDSESPTMQAIFQFVDKALANQKRTLLRRQHNALERLGYALNKAMQ